MSVYEKIWWVIACHFAGDYFLQTDHMARNKASNPYILLAHCVCYCIPFTLIFGVSWKLPVIFAVHIAADFLKANRGYLTITQDQAIHFLTALVYLI